MEIPAKPSDDPQFIELLGHIISGLLADNFPEHIFVICIDNWFDQKWLNFSGIGRVGLFWGLRDPDTALAEFRQAKITFPPFSPNRVLEEYYFRRNEHGDYSSLNPALYIHSKVHASSCENLHRRVEDYAHSAIYAWFSSNTKSNCRGSLMAYEVDGGKVHTWFASFSKKGEEWQLSQTKQVSREQVQSLMRHDVLQGRK